MTDSDSTDQPPEPERVVVLMFGNEVPGSFVSEVIAEAQEHYTDLTVEGATLLGRRKPAERDAAEGTER